MYELAEKNFDSSATNTILVSDILIKDYNCKLGNKRQILKDNILVLPKEILCNPSFKSKTIHAFNGSWNNNKMSFIGKFDVWLRGKMFNKKRIIIYMFFNYILFLPKRYFGNIIKNKGVH